VTPSSPIIAWIDLENIFEGQPRSAIMATQQTLPTANAPPPANRATNPRFSSDVWTHPKVIDPIPVMPFMVLGGTNLWRLLVLIRVWWLGMARPMLVRALFSPYFLVPFLQWLAIRLLVKALAWCGIGSGELLSRKQIARAVKVSLLYHGLLEISSPSCS
jgi:hypothetical protein